MLINYNREKIQELLKDFSVLTRINVAFSDCHANPVCHFHSADGFCNSYQKIGSNKAYCLSSDNHLLERCQKSGKYEYHICHAGLYDAAMPVVKRHITVGYILVGGIRTPGKDKDTDGSFDDNLRILYNQIPVFNAVQLSCLKNLLSHILFSNAIEFENTSLAENIREYIEENINDDITAAAICKKFFLSRNSLYKTFRENFNCTPVEYLTDCRLKRAKKLLAETKEPIYTICERVGIHNYSYFCNLFKKKTGVTPVAYRKTDSEPYP